MELEPRQVFSKDWITILLMACFILYTAVRYFFPKRFEQFAILPFTNKYLKVQGKEDSIGHPFQMLLFISQVFSVSVFIFLFLSQAGSMEIRLNASVLLKIGSLYTAFVVIKINLERIIGSVFSIDRLIDDYLFKKLTYRNYLALLLFGINLLLIYLMTPGNTMLFIIFGIIIAFNISSLIYIYKTYFGLLLPNFFYFILYLCTLEISPYIILYKLMREWGLV